MTAADAWALFLFGNIAWITPLDLWFHFTGRHTMTRQMHDWIFHSQAAQFIIPGALFLLAWFIVHEIIYHAPGP